MLNLLLVALGGAAGAVASYLLSVQSTRAFGTTWPYGTFAANIIGGFLMGALTAALVLRTDGDERLRLLLAVGVLGGFTTFSAYSLEVAGMIARRDYGAAAAYATLSVVGSVAALFAGMALVRRAFG